MKKRALSFYFLFAGLGVIAVLLILARVTNYKLIKESDFKLPIQTQAPLAVLSPSPQAMDSNQNDATDSANPDASSGATLRQVTVSEGSNGKTITISKGEDFEIYLNYKNYPMKSLEYSKCPLGYVSSMSTNGFDNYPIGFQGIEKGSCTIKNGDFSVNIKVN